MPTNAKILVIEDDPDISQLLKTFLTEEGFEVVTAPEGRTAKSLVMNGGIIPDLILADFNLPGAETGLQVAHDLRAHLRRAIPVIISTGDISTVTLRLIAAEDCVQMNKPMKLAALMDRIGALLAGPAATAHDGPTLVTTAVPAPRAVMRPANERRLVFVIDDDPDIRETMRATFELGGKQVETFVDAESFLAVLPTVVTNCCLVVDASLPGISGLQLIQKLTQDGVDLPAIMVTGQGDIGLAVQAMKAGAEDFMEKPVDSDELLACVRRIMEQNRGHQAVTARRQDAAEHIAGLTMRQREVMERVLAGEPSKNIAADLGISRRTVENHRASIMLKTGVKSIPALARLAVDAASPPPGAPHGGAAQAGSAQAGPAHATAAPEID